GRPISSWQTQWKGVRGSEAGVRGQGSGLSKERSSSLTPDPCPLTPYLWLDLPREVLYARIDARVERMIAEGLLDEVRARRGLPRPPSREAAQALGYKELFDHLDGRATLAEAVRQIQTRSRNFAKRQLSWFRHLPECRPTTPELTFARWGLTMEG